MPTKTQTASPSAIDLNYPMFVFSRSRYSEHESDDVPESVYKKLREQLREMRQTEQTDDDDDDETEEFVIL